MGSVMNFTIDSDNNISAGGIPSAADESFTTQKDLAKLAARWPAARLVEIWNSFAGVTPFDDLQPVKKFTNREVAVKRIFEAVGRLEAAVAKPAAHVAPAKRKGAKGPAKAKKAAAPRTSADAKDGSKKADVIEMMRRKDGVSLEEIMQKTGWQRHTVRGFVSGTLGTKMGLKVESFRSTENKERHYRIVG
jgi:hypothetical protein